MYVPRAFAENDTLTLHEQMQATALPVLITQGPQGLMASHVPLLLKAEEGQYGTLYGHLARANPQCQELAEGAQALVIFAGEQAYISPSFYPSKAEHGKAVPTWNYVAVHAYAQPDVFEDAPRLLELVSQLSNRHEANRPKPLGGERCACGLHRQHAQGHRRFPLAHHAPHWQTQTQPKPQRCRSGRRTQWTAGQQQPARPRTCSINR